VSKFVTRSLRGVARRKIYCPQRVAILMYYRVPCEKKDF
jgi:hypothetical protein